MRHESCFCSRCGHYNAEAGVVVSKQADEIARLKEAARKQILEQLVREGQWIEREVKR